MSWLRWKKLVIIKSSYIVLSIVYDDVLEIPFCDIQLDPAITDIQLDPAITDLAVMEIRL